MFRNAKIGNRVYDYLYQSWGTIIETSSESSTYPLLVSFGKSRNKSYTLSGMDYSGNNVPVLFWDEVKPIIPPSKPFPDLEVDTHVLVWVDDNSEKFKRHFSHFEPDGTIFCFTKGNSEWSSDGSTVMWENWELAE